MQNKRYASSFWCNAFFGCHQAAYDIKLIRSPIKINDRNFYENNAARSGHKSAY